jgi:hypothetical protein
MDAIENVVGELFLGFGVDKPTFTSAFDCLVLFVGMASVFLVLERGAWW